MKTIKTTETLLKVLEEKGSVLHITPNGYLLEEANAHILNEKNEVIYEVNYYAYARAMGLKNHKRLMEREQSKLTLNDLPSYHKKLERKRQHEQRKQATQRRLEAYEAIEYLKGWQEGDNITITADFMKNVEAIAEYLESLKK